MDMPAYVYICDTIVAHPVLFVVCTLCVCAVLETLGNICLGLLTKSQELLVCILKQGKSGMDKTQTKPDDGVLEADFIVLNNKKEK